MGRSKSLQTWGIQISWGLTKEIWIYRAIWKSTQNDYFLTLLIKKNLFLLGLCCQLWLISFSFYMITYYLSTFMLLNTFTHLSNVAYISPEKWVEQNKLLFFCLFLFLEFLTRQVNFFFHSEWINIHCRIIMSVVEELLSKTLYDLVCNRIIPSLT